MSEPGSALVVLVTAPSEEAALTLARALVDERLAACVNVVPGVTSIYTWQGKREETAEALLVIKTAAPGYAALERRVLELHPYSVPEVLALPVAAGAHAYVQWVRESVAVEGR
jgi:periplasmic divalent cation tolerance protein